MENEQARIEEINAIRDYCTIAGKPELANTYALSGLSKEQVLAQLYELHLKAQQPEPPAVNDLKH